MNQTILQELKEIKHKIALCDINDTHEILNILYSVVDVVEDMAYYIK